MPVTKYRCSTKKLQVEHVRDTGRWKLVGKYHSPYLKIGLTDFMWAYSSMYVWTVYIIKKHTIAVDWWQTWKIKPWTYI